MTSPDPMTVRVAGFVAAFTRVDGEMRDLPVYNPSLEVEAIGFRFFESHWIGTIVTPWFMSVIALRCDPLSADELEVGDTRHWTLPSGEYVFRIGEVGDGIRYQSLSLFSPMTRFNSQDAARDAANGALDALFGQVPDGESRPPDRSDALPPEIARRNRQRREGL